MRPQLPRPLAATAAFAGRGCSTTAAGLYLKTNRFQPSMWKLPRALAPRLSGVVGRLAIRFDNSGLRSADALAAFVRTRASYVAQTALYGYLKARMGTSYRLYFEDDTFSASIRAAAVKLFLSCLADLTVFAVATANREGALAPAEAAALARHCFRRAALHGLPEEEGGAPADALAAFDARADATVWSAAARGRTAFGGSEADLVRFAPVIDAYKDLDREIVTNSIRFRWRDVREQARRRIDPEALCRDWTQRAGGRDG